MSHEPSDDIKPQPGADPGDYKSNGLPYADIGHGCDTAEIGPDHTAEWPPDFLPDWPKLLAAHAVDFAYDSSLKAVRIKKEPDDLTPGTWTWTIEEVWPEPLGPKAKKCLYRVWGDWAVPSAPDWAGWDIGRYWRDEFPNSEDDFYGKAAVEFHWNSGRYVAQLKNAGLITEMRGWSGTIARQPADGMDPHHRPLPLTLLGYHLAGGAIQYFIPDGTLPYIDEKYTPWNPPVLARETIPRPDLRGLQPPGKGTVADGSHYLALAILVGYLARLLEAASTEGAEFGFRNSPLTGQAAILRATGDQLRAHAGYLPDAAAKAQSKLIAQSLVPIARYLDGYPRGSYGGEIEGAINEVVKWAYAIGVKAT